MTRGSGGRRRGSRRRPRRSPRSGTPGWRAGGPPPSAVWRAARTPDRAARGCPWHWRRRQQDLAARGPGLARRCRDGAVVQPAVGEAQQHAVVRADLDLAGEAEALGCVADDAPGDAAVEQAVGRADDVAALDRQPLGAHLPADAAAVMDLPRGLEVAFGGGLRGRGDAGERQRGGERGRAGEARHGAADGVLLPVEGGLGIAAGDLLGAPGGGPVDLEGAGDDVLGRDQRGDRPAALVPNGAELARAPARAGAAALRDQSEDLGVGHLAVDHEAAPQALLVGPGAPGLEGLVVDPRGRETGAGDEAAASVDAASVPAIYPGRVGGRARRGPARAVPHRHQSCWTIAESRSRRPESWPEARMRSARRVLRRSRRGRAGRRVGPSR